jgi:hypothetical protein
MEPIRRFASSERGLAGNVRSSRTHETASEVGFPIGNGELENASFHDVCCVLPSTAERKRWNLRASVALGK